MTPENNEALLKILDKRHEFAVGEFMNILIICQI